MQTSANTELFVWKITVTGTMLVQFCLYQKMTTFIASVENDKLW
jgi:hypothetical protein